MGQYILVIKFKLYTEITLITLRLALVAYGYINDEQGLESPIFGQYILSRWIHHDSYTLILFSA